MLEKKKGCKSIFLAFTSRYKEELIKPSIHRERDIINIRVKFSEIENK